MRNTRTRDGLSKNNRIEDLSSITILKRIVLFVGLFIAAFLLYHRDTLVGYWRFHHLCKVEGGSRIYEPVEKNVGWMVKKKYRISDKSPAFHFPFPFQQDFIRFETLDGEIFDTFIVNPPPPPHIEKFLNYSNLILVIPADESRSVRYSHETTVTFSFDGKIFMTIEQVNKKGIKFFEHEYFKKKKEWIIDLHNKKTVATYTEFFFNFGKPGQFLSIFSQFPEPCFNLPAEGKRNFYSEIYQQRTNP